MFNCIFITIKIRYLIPLLIQAYLRETRRSFFLIILLLALLNRE